MEFSNRREWKFKFPAVSCRYDRRILNQSQITDLVSWIEAFSIYTLILTSYFPHRWRDLTVYKLLIIRTYRQFVGRAWMNYDKAFRWKPSLNMSYFKTSYLVWAKMRGYPWWPAEVQEEPIGNKLPIFFFGTHQTVLMSCKSLMHFGSRTDFPQTFKRKRPTLGYALEEIERLYWSRIEESKASPVVGPAPYPCSSPSPGASGIK